uniref:PAP/OAS1 substrate-binding-related domain-containing protein n=1 Tax=Quercus lobata TaxID=97700 RepID=A0A7N2LR45_QUELO
MNERITGGCLLSLVSYRVYQVFPYGSVPLKTYLPDGDIDLTTLSCPSVEDAWVSDVHAVLREEEHNEASRFEVKNIHCIDAEVKRVKCIVQNIMVDISFNQLGGLCTLCFLEQVDRLVGKDHLFKRSIILIKAWCYYESRILGAHHGLLSTYALETLVLYIFHQFHSSLNAPLAVLYRFLDYFSRFDWESYCISLSGPVCKSSLPDIVAEVQENGGDDLLLSEEFLRNCAEMFSVSPKGSETNSRAFTQKHLNIIDPLKENNNLRRSVNRGMILLASIVMLLEYVQVCF